MRHGVLNIHSIMIYLEGIVKISLIYFPKTQFREKVRKHIYKMDTREVEKVSLYKIYCKNYKVLYFNIRGVLWLIDPVNIFMLLRTSHTLFLVQPITISMLIIIIQHFFQATLNFTNNSTRRRITKNMSLPGVRVLVVATLG